MNIKRAVAILATLLILAGAPALASEESVQESPIRIDSVQIEQSYGVFGDFAAGLVSVAFTNTSAATATDVVFDLLGYDGALIAQYNDVGTFAQGVTVRHSFPDIHIDNDQQLQVGEAIFDDGTSWTAPSRGTVPRFIVPSE